MSLRVIQTANINGGSQVTSASVAFGNPFTPGNLVIAGWRVTAGSPNITITSGNGNTWTTVYSITNGVAGFAFSPVTINGGADTITWHTTSAGFPRVIFAEIYYGSTGVSTWTNTAFSESAIGATTTPNSGTISDSTSDLIFGVAANQTDSTALTTAAGWNLIQQISTVDPGVYWKTASGSDSFSGTSASASWGIGIANARPTLSGSKPGILV